MLFDIKGKPDADASSPWYECVEAGKSAVASYGNLVEAEARRQGVDADLVKAILCAEHTRGHNFGIDKAAEGFGLAGSILPMNIRPGIWGGLGLNTTLFSPIVIDSHGTDPKGIYDFVEGNDGLLPISPKDPEFGIILCDPHFGLALGYIAPFGLLFFSWR